ncbi:hypothetical protein AOLI_G00191140 [Acnodon oligacanthus]
MEVRHGRLAPVGFEQLKGRLDLAPTAARPAASIYSTVQQQDYLASVWLSKKEKLEHALPCLLQVSLPFQYKPRMIVQILPNILHSGAF